MATFAPTPLPVSGGSGRGRSHAAEDEARLGEVVYATDKP